MRISKVHGPLLGCAWCLPRRCCRKSPSLRGGLPRQSGSIRFSCRALRPYRRARGPPGGEDHTRHCGMGGRTRKTAQSGGRTGCLRSCMVAGRESAGGHGDGGSLGVPRKLSRGRLACRIKSPLGRVDGVQLSAVFTAKLVAGRRTCGCDREQRRHIVG